MVCPGNDRLWRKFAELLGHPEWPDEPRYKKLFSTTASEIAAALGIAEKAAQKRIERGVRRLRPRL